MFVKIDDAPFTDEEKAAIKAMGFTGADWGHPLKVLDDPVEYFKESLRNMFPFKIDYTKPDRLPHFIEFDFEDD